MINELLSIIKKDIENDIELLNKVKTGENFEIEVFEKFQKIKLKFPDLNISSITHNGAHSFPDLKVKFKNNNVFGIEIKFSASGNWRSKGNSIFESLSNKENNDESYKEIYVLFGRKPKEKENVSNIEIKFAPYGKSIEKIEVTHSPRFSINMLNGSRDVISLFGKDSNYADFRVKSNEEKNEFLRNYFNETIRENSVDKWYHYKSNDEKIEEVKPILLSDLQLSIKEKIIAESFILYIGDLFKSKANYSNVAANMISQHFVYAPSLRDSFTAGGQDRIKESNVNYPKILITFSNHVNTIKELLRNPPYENFEDKCFRTWKKSFIENKEITIDENQDIEFCYELIIKNFRPVFNVEYMLDKKKKAGIDLAQFYPLEKINKRTSS